MLTLGDILGDLAVAGLSLAVGAAATIFGAGRVLGGKAIIVERHEDELSDHTARLRTIELAVTATQVEGREMRALLVEVRDDVKELIRGKPSR